MKNANVNAKKLFEDYQAAQDAVAAARKALETAMAERSATVLTIKTDLGDGPFVWRSATIQVSKRSTKDDAGTVVGTSYFFKEIGAAVQTIE